MSENAKRDPLATVEAFEAGAFRVAHVARQLLADHPDLPVWQIRPYVAGYQDPGATHAKLEISTPTTDGVRAWADVLGATADVKFFDARRGGQTFEFHQAQVTVSGVEVTVVASRHDLTEEEIAAWRAKQDQAAAEGGEGR